MKASEVLRAGQLTFQQGDNWAGGAEGYYGRCKECCYTVLAHGIGGSHEKTAAMKALCAAVGIRFNDEEHYEYAAPQGELYHWNDAPERTFADVEAAFQKAIQLAEAEGN